MEGKSAIPGTTEQQTSIAPTPAVQQTTHKVNLLL
jgi:hypothetical protein